MLIFPGCPLGGREREEREKLGQEGGENTNTTTTHIKAQVLRTAFEKTANPPLLFLARDPLSAVATVTRHQSLRRKQEQILFKDLRIKKYVQIRVYTNRNLTDPTRSKFMKLMYIFEGELLHNNKDNNSKSSLSKTYLTAKLGRKGGRGKKVLTGTFPPPSYITAVKEAREEGRRGGGENRAKFQISPPLSFLLLPGLYGQKSVVQSLFSCFPPWLFSPPSHFRSKRRQTFMRAREKNSWTTKMALLNKKIPFFRWHKRYALASLICR